MKVLLADDDTKIHVIIRMWLDQQGHKTVGVRNGQDALAELQSESFDILISDVNMPVVNGINLVKHVVQQPDRPGLIVLLTSRCDRDEIAQQFQEQDVHLLSKPFSPKTLADIVAQYALSRERI